MTQIRDGNNILRPWWAPVRWWIRKRCSIAYRLGYHDGWSDSIGYAPSRPLINTFGEAKR